MDEVPLLNEGGTVREFMALHGPPAYVRRAQEVEAAFAGLIDHCRRRRDQWLELVRVRLATVHALAGDWEALRPLVGVGADRLRDLHDELRPRLRAPLARTSSLRALRRALDELAESAARFNRRWLDHVARLDLSHVNGLREGYNRYYVVEKECALRSPALARQGFVPLKPVTVEEILAELPPLPEVRPTE